MLELSSVAWAIHDQFFLEMYGLWIWINGERATTSVPAQDKVSRPQSLMHLFTTSVSQG